MDSFLGVRNERVVEGRVGEAPLEAGESDAFDVWLDFEVSWIGSGLQIGLDAREESKPAMDVAPGLFLAASRS